MLSSCVGQFFSNVLEGGERRKELEYRETCDKVKKKRGWKIRE
jgi:hypothetical protein